MGDLVLLNFKVPPESAYSIQREMGFHDLNRSEFVRQCIRIAGPLLREAPGLLEADDKRVADLMSKVGKILVTLEKV
ncbi:hypothetical protein AAAU16_04130 [Desulfovibrio piger]|uniref:hypothetical protein n=1 Tax=Desulfovibrio piger TaxID=901 RepID=UPI0032C16038